MSNNFFEFEIEHGCFWKAFVDFLAESMPKCTMTLNNTGIRIQSKNVKQGANKYAMFIYLNKSSFSLFNLKEEILNDELEECSNLTPIPCQIQFITREMQKHCKTIKKKEVVKLSLPSENSDVSNLVLTISDRSKPYKIERKDLSISSHVTHIRDISDFQQGEDEVQYLASPYSLKAEEIQNLKKTIGVKNSFVEITIYEDRRLEFRSNSQGSAPLVLIFENNPNKPLPNSSYKIQVSGSIIVMLSKLFQLSTDLNFYQPTANSTARGIMISGCFDKPKYMGNYRIIVSEDLRLKKVINEYTIGQNTD